MKISTNYGLKLMEGTDNIKRQDFVDNFEKIDTQMKAIENTGIPYGFATGSANTYAVTLSSAPVVYTDGMVVCVKINIASTGASTLNVNNLGAKQILDSLGNAITAGGLKANIPYTLRYNGTSFVAEEKIDSKINEIDTQIPTIKSNLGDIVKKDGTVQPNLNADMIDGKHENSFCRTMNYGGIDISNPGYPAPYMTDVYGSYSAPDLDWWHIIYIPHQNYNAGYGAQLAIAFHGKNVTYTRSSIGTSWGPWKRLLDETDYNNILNSIPKIITSPNDANLSQMPNNSIWIKYQ